MADEATEIRKQLTMYADAITAFAVAQSVTFVFLMAHGDCFTKNVVYGRWYAVGFGCFANVGYLVLVFLCHRAEDNIPKRPNTLGAPMRGVRILRYTIIMIALLATTFLPLAISTGWHQGHFFIDCKSQTPSSTLQGDSASK